MIVFRRTYFANHDRVGKPVLDVAKANPDAVPVETATHLRRVIRVTTIGTGSVAEIAARTLLLERRVDAQAVDALRPHGPGVIGRRLFIMIPVVAGTAENRGSRD